VIVPDATRQNRYVGKLHMAARHDAVLANAFLKVANLTMSPAGLLHPAVVMRVIYGNIRWRKAGAVRFVNWITNRGGDFWYAGGCARK
jgi:hypothetical protein